MAPRTTKPKPEDADPLAPKTEKAKVEKTKTPKIKAEKVVKPKLDKTDKPAKPKVEKGDGKVVKEGKEGKGGKEAKGGKEGKEEKVKAVVGEEAMELIRAYLERANRPYSATEVSANLHGKVTKTVADKLLKEMEQNGTIMGKATNGDKKGSQWVFWALQNPADAATPEELARMEATISTLRTTIPTLKSTLKTTTARLNTILSAPTTAALSSMINDLQTSNAGKKSKLQAFKDGTVKIVSKEEAERVEKDNRHWKSRERARREAFRGLEDVCLQSGVMSKEELWEKAGIEGDE